jgi:Family of unknown function (DUF5715)
MRARSLLFALLFASLLPASLFAHTTTQKPGTHSSNKHLRRTRTKLRSRHRFHRIRFVYTPVRGSRESLLRQNQKITEEDLERIQNDEQLEALKQTQELVELPEDKAVAVAENLPADRRYCRPWTRKFLEDFGARHYELFHTPMTVTSAVRTVEFQQQLMRRNHNAAPESGDLASPHLSGATIDIGKRGMTRRQLKWARSYLLELQNAGLIDAEEEFHQSVFHVTVYRDYDIMTGDRASAAGGGN